MKARLVESRRKLLDQFCKAVAEIPHLYHSEEFQVFCKGSRKYEDARLDFPAPNLEDIRVSYELLFTEAKPDPQLGWLQPQEIPQFQLRINSIAQSCVTARHELKKMKLFARDFQTVREKLQNCFQHFSDTIYLEYSSGNPVKTLNLANWPNSQTFSPILDLVKSEQVATNCVLDTLRSRLALSHQVESVSHSLDCMQVHYTSLQAGKRSVTDRLGLKPASLEGLREKIEKVTGNAD